MISALSKSSGSCSWATNPKITILPKSGELQIWLFCFSFYAVLDSLAAGLTCCQIYTFESMCFYYVSIIAYFLSAVVAHAPTMLLNTLQIGHDTN